MKSFSLSWKLILGFTLITLCIGGEGLLGVDSMDRVTQKLQQISEEDSRAISLVASARIEASYHSRSIYRFLLTRDEDKISVRSALVRREINVLDQMNSYRKKNLTKDEKALLSRFFRAWKDYKASSDDLLLATVSTLPVAENRTFLDRIAAVEDDLEALIRLNQGYAERDKAEGTKILLENKGVLMFFLILSKVLSIAFAVWFSLRVTQPLKRLSQALRHAAEGNYDFPLPKLRSRDEIAVLNEELIRMQGALKARFETG